MDARLEHANALQQKRGPDATARQLVRGVTFVHNLLHMTGARTLQPCRRGDPLGFTGSA